MVVIDTQFNIFNVKETMPDLIINVKCPPDIAFQRIKERNRKGEEKIDLKYLIELHKYEKIMIDTLMEHTKLKYIDNSENLISNENL